MKHYHRHNIIKICLSLAILAGFGALIRHSYLLFTHATSALIGSIILIVGGACWILLIKLLRSRYKWVKPSFKLTTFSVIAILLILTFAGVQPMSTYKDNLIESWKTAQTGWATEKPEAEVLRFDLFSDESTGFSVEYPKNWSAKAIVMEDKEVTRVSFEGKMGEGGETLCSLLISYDPSFTDVKGLWLSMINLAGSYLESKRGPITIGEIQGYELTQRISGEDSRIVVCEWETGSLLAYRSYPIGALTSDELDKLNNYLEHLIVSASINESESSPTLPKDKGFDLEGVEKGTFNLINLEREKVGLLPTKWDDELYKLSEAHTQEMANRGEVFHTPLGASYGENCWGGIGYYHYDEQELARVIVNCWMSSPLHRAWLLHKPLQTSVVSIVVTPAGQYASWTFWTREAGEGPALVRQIMDKWIQETGGSISWIEWLRIKGYIE